MVAVSVIITQTDTCNISSLHPIRQPCAVQVACVLQMAAAGRMQDPSLAQAGVWGDLVDLDLAGLDGLLTDAFMFEGEEEAAAGMAALFPASGRNVRGSDPALLVDLRWVVLMQQQQLHQQQLLQQQQMILQQEQQLAQQQQLLVTQLPDWQQQQQKQLAEAHSSAKGSTASTTSNVPASPSPAATMPPPDPPVSAPQPPARRGRGRPPKASGDYTKGYLYVKEYRSRKKDEFSTLAKELDAKMAELQLLTAENVMLQAREEVLQAAVSSSAVAALDQLQGGLKPSETAAAGAAVARGTALSSVGCAGTADTPSATKQQQQQQQPAAACIQTEHQLIQQSLQLEHLNLAPYEHWHRIPDDMSTLRGFLSLYVEYVNRMRLRPRNPDGSVAPLQPGQERWPPNRELMRLSMALTLEETAYVCELNLVSAIMGVGGGGKGCHMACNQQRQQQQQQQQTTPIITLRQVNITTAIACICRRPVRCSESSPKASGRGWRTASTLGLSRWITSGMRWASWRRR